MESQQGAVHEATHAVTALQFGFEVPKVTIIEDSDYAGHTIVNTPAYNGQGKKKYLSVIYADALVSLVGVIVDLAFKGDEFCYYLTTDFKDASEKLCFYLAAKRDLLDPSEYYEVDGNRLTVELFHKCPTLSYLGTAQRLILNASRWAT
jgi:hypothetical protein